jgi:hypothetical protein
MDLLDQFADGLRRAVLAVKTQADAALKFVRQVVMAPRVTATVRAVEQTSTKFASAASPEAFSTLTDSFKLVAMELGQYLIPALVDGAIMAQRFAQWLAELPPATKEWLNWLGYGAGALAVFGQANLLTGGLLGKLAAGLLGPLAPAAGLAVALAAAGAATWDFFTWQKRMLDEAKNIHERTKVKSADELHASDVYREVAAAGTKEDRQAVSDRQLFEANRERRGLEEQAHRLLDGSNVLSRWWRSDEIQDLQKRMEENVRKSKLIEATRNELNADKMPAGVDVEKVQADIAKRLVEAGKGVAAPTQVPAQGGAPAGKAGGPGGGTAAAAGGQHSGGSPFVAHRMQVGQARFSAVEEARKSLQRPASTKTRCSRNCKRRRSSSLKSSKRSGGAGSPKWPTA